MAGIKGYITNITNQTPEFVIGAYHRLGHIEKAFRIVVVDRPRAHVMPGHWGSHGDDDVVAVSDHLLQLRSHSA